MLVFNALLLVFVLSAPQDGEACLGGGSNGRRLTGVEGGNITFDCFFDDPRVRKVLCRDDCGEGDVLIDTKDHSAESGRYRIDYYERLLRPSMLVVHVSIKNLTKADSGKYSCMFGENRSPSLTQRFQLTVGDALTNANPERTTQALSPTPSTPALSTPPNTGATTEAPTASDPNSTLSATSPPPTLEPTSALADLVTPAAAKGLPMETNSGVQPNVQLLLVVMIVISAAGLLVACRRRTRRHEDLHVGLECVNASTDEEGSKKILEM